MEEQALPLTHEFLAIMLSVNRPGVTVALKSLDLGGPFRKGGVTLRSSTAPHSKRSRASSTQKRFFNPTKNCSFCNNSYRNSAGVDLIAALF